MAKLRRQVVDELSREGVAARRRAVVDQLGRIEWCRGLAVRIAQGAPFLMRADGREFLVGEGDEPVEVYEARPGRPPTDPDSELRFVDGDELVPMVVEWRGVPHRLGFL